MYATEHARGGGNNPTVGCEVVAGGLRKCVEFLESYGSIKFRTKGNGFALSFMQLPMPKFYAIMTQRIYMHNPPPVGNDPKMVIVTLQNFRYADTFVAILVNKVRNAAVYGGNQ